MFRRLLPLTLLTLALSAGIGQAQPAPTVTLHATFGAANATSYEVSQSVNGSAYQVVGSVTPATPGAQGTFDAPGLPMGQTLCLKVKATGPFDSKESAPCCHVAASVGDVTLNCQLQ